METTRYMEIGPHTTRLQRNYTSLLIWHLQFVHMRKTISFTRLQRIQQDNIHRGPYGQPVIEEEIYKKCKLHRVVFIYLCVTPFKL